MLDAARWQTHDVSERDLVVLTEQPLNAETRLDRLDGVLTPAGRHYVRTHFPIPVAPTVLELDGARRIALSADEIRAMPSRTLRVTLECAGNGRRFLEPAVPGEQWGLGAVGTAEWTGVSLAAVLGRAGLRRNTSEVLFRGADEGVPKDLGRRIAYERSLPVADALRDNVIVAYAMDGASIAREHGGPLRLVVAGWYGMASVKWLARIDLLDRPFRGFYQTDRYVIDGRPLREMATRAVIASPAPGSVSVERGRAATIDVHGYAWSGAGRIAKVEIMAAPAGGSGAGTWRDAALGPQATPYSWREFSLRALVAIENGRSEMDVDLMARATDETGNAQPLAARWNPLGYANNAVHPVRVRMRG
jgi:DMSO/TMAO reductase YedYZ molybdopterin-dependent catalytic subunit